MQRLYNKILMVQFLFNLILRHPSLDPSLRSPMTFFHTIVF
ncbi:hypothetical protein [Oscillatoria salina]